MVFDGMLKIMGLAPQVGEGHWLHTFSHHCQKSLICFSLPIRVSKPLNGGNSVDSLQLWLIERECHFLNIVNCYPWRKKKAILFEILSCVIQIQIVDPCTYIAIELFNFRIHLHIPVSTIPLMVLTVILWFSLVINIITCLKINQKKCY